MRALSFSDFCLNEGASLNKRNGKITLNWRDDKNDEYEFLKTNNTMAVTNVIKPQRGKFPIYYGLEIDPDKLKELKGKADVKLAMDWLKAAEIEGGLSAIVNFSKPIIAHINKTKKIDYVIPMGSTKGLSKELSEAVASIVPNANVVPLDKHEFETITQAIDWDYLEEYESSGNRSVLPRLINIIRAEIQTTSPEVLNSLRRVTDWRDLKGILLRGNPKSRYFEPENEIVWANDSFKIRSSGTLFGGLRKVFKTKYQTPKESGEFGSPEFVEALRDCIFRNKTLLFVDDNARSKKDISGIIDSLIKLADNMLADYDGQPSLQHRGWAQRVMSYVLIYVKDTIPLAGDDEVQAIEPFYKINRENDNLEDK